ncbi:MAG: nucleotidyltransferase domain-containing protein [Promethearchaeati archaeon]
MKNSKNLEKIKNDLKFCNEYWTIIYGRFLSDNYIVNRSDIDIAIITKIKNKAKNIETWDALLAKAPSNYDVRVFELFPLYIQIDIIQNYKTIFGDALEISEYFYPYRKIWRDILPRIKENQFESIQEKLRLMEYRKAFL